MTELYPIYIKSIFKLALMEIQGISQNKEAQELRNYLEDNYDTLTHSERHRVDQFSEDLRHVEENLAELVNQNPTNEVELAFYNATKKIGW